MDNVILNSYSKILNLNVSRETCNDLEHLILMIQEKNKEINIIVKKITWLNCDENNKYIGIEIDATNEAKDEYLERPNVTNQEIIKIKLK